jgi:hypothetical protein
MADRRQAEVEQVAHHRGERRERRRAAYADAVSEYAALGRDELREAARALIAVTSGRG